MHTILLHSYSTLHQSVPFYYNTVLQVTSQMSHNNTILHMVTENEHSHPDTQEFYTETHNDRSKGSCTNSQNYSHVTTCGETINKNLKYKHYCFKGV